MFFLCIFNNSDTKAHKHCSQSLAQFVLKQATSHKNSPPTLYVWNCWSGSLVSIIRSNMYDDLTPPSNCPIGVSSSSSYDISRDSWNSSYLTRRHWVSGRILSKPSNWWNKQYRNLKTICKTICRRFIRRWKKKKKIIFFPDRLRICIFRDFIVVNFANIM